jgi:hemerythrin superfamily protein
MLNDLLPSVTNVIRLDHTHVLSTFHQYKDAAPRRVKKGLVLTICTALEVHAQLEEEVFYPALRAVTDDEILLESPAEHDEMRRLIALLRRMEPEARDYTSTLMALMREVIHHVADEETVLLPMAEDLLHDQLGSLGAKMTRRRIQLVAPRTGDIALNMGRAASGNTIALAAVGVGALAALLWHRLDPRGPDLAQRRNRVPPY